MKKLVLAATAALLMFTANAAQAEQLYKRLPNGQFVRVESNAHHNKHHNTYRYEQRYNKYWPVMVPYYAPRPQPPVAQLKIWYSSPAAPCPTPHHR